MVERYVLRIALILVAVTVAGCSLMAPPQAGAPAGREDGGAAPVSAPVGQQADDALRPVNPAAAQFIAAATNWQEIDDEPRAAAALERAIRIDPGHPLPWLELARLRYNGGDIRQAENLALKARNLAPRDAPLFNDAEALLIEIQKTPL